MKLDNFKEILLRKSADNQDLQLLIKYIKDDFLVDHIVESLEKMAIADANRKTNAAVKHFGSNVDEHIEGEMIHDQLGHHASHYKAALKAGDKRTADKHMRKIFNTMYAVHKLTRDGKENHTGNQLNVDAIDPKPWEESKKANTASDTNGWKQDRDNYDYMREAPHPGRSDQTKGDGSVKKYKKNRYLSEIKAHGHNKSYPLEEIKINGKHIHLEDIEHKGNFQPHPFDSHPIIEHARTPSNEHSDAAHAKYLKEHNAFHGEGGGADQYWNMVDTRDPQEHAARGSKKSNPVHAHINEHKSFKPLSLDSTEAVSPSETPAAAPAAPKMSPSDVWANSPMNPKNKNKGGQ